MFELKKRGLYAILPEAYTFLLFYAEKSDDNKLTFIHMPDMHTITFEDKKEFHIFLQHRKLDLVEQLPQDVYDECILNIE